MSNKVYVKKGNISLKEKAMVRELEKTYARLVEEDPDFVVKTANSPSELEDLYNKYAIIIYIKIDINFIINCNEYNYNGLYIYSST